MTSILGYNFFGTEFFRSPSNGLTNAYYGEIKNAIVDELSIRSRTDVTTENIRDTWELDHRAIFKFLGDLEGGNITNSGLQIVSFQIKRRRASDIDSYTLATMDFVNNTQVEYFDYTQPNDELIYSIVPIAENQLQGAAADVQIESDFTGWFLVDKETNNVLAFDKAIGSVGDVETTLNQGRTVINTFSRFPTTFYNPNNYHEFTLSTVIIPEEFRRSGYDYKQVLDNFIYNHKPFLVKSDNGRVYICDVSNPRATTPQNTWKDYDYIQLSLDFMEVGTESEYMDGVL